MASKPESLLLRAVLSLTGTLFEEKRWKAGLRVQNLMQLLVVLVSVV